MAINNQPTIEPRTITGIFTKYIAKTLPLAFDESMSYYECLCALLNYLNETIVPDINNTNEGLSELQEFYLQLQNYVNNYFENLDVQEEINNKLDEMAESGQLTDLIAQYLQLAGVLAYDTKAAMKNAENIAEGSICKTLGNLSYTDGQGAFYKVRKVINTDVIDNENIISLSDETLVAEKIPFSKSYELQQQINQNTEDIEKVKDIITEVNLCNNITFDLPSAYADWYTQGSAVYNNILYVYIEKNNSGKLLAFNYNNYTFINEYNVDLAHGGDLTIIENTMYAVKWNGSKDIVVVDLTDYTTSTISVPVDENKLAGISKIDDDNLFITASNDYTSNFNNVGFYTYNITNSTLQKFTTSSDILINFYATQGINYRNGYLYYLVSNPDQIIKCKIDFDNHTIKFVGTYKLPEKDNLGLLVGEYEAIDNIPNSDNMIITSHILDDTLTSRTLKTYIINLEHNVPEFPLYYNNINIIGSIKDGDYNVYLNKSKNTTTYLELGTAAYPFKSLARTINHCKSKKQNSILITSTNNDFDIYKISAINNADITINILNNNIEIDIQRILGSKVVISSEQVPSTQVPNTNSFVKFINYSDASYFGSIVNSTVKFFCNLHIAETLEIFKSLIMDTCIITSTVPSGTPIFKIRRDSVYIENTNWTKTNTNGNDAYFRIQDGGTLLCNNISSNQSTWYSTHVTTGGTNTINVIFAGVHYNS